MAERTIKISPLAEGTTQQQIRNALTNQNITRIHIAKDMAYVEFQTSEDIETLEFTHQDNRLENLNNAQFDKVQPTFKWGSLSSDSSEIQELKDDRDFHEKVEEHINLTDPSPQNLVTISNCDQKLLDTLSENEIKSTVFAGFHSINRILKRGNKVIIQIEDPSETERIETIFPNLRTPGLGGEAYVDLDAQPIPNFAAEWIAQHHQQNQKIKSMISSANTSAKTEEEPKRYLHEDIIPKLNKMTSMETDFLLKHPKTELDQQKNIPEQSEEHIHTDYKLPSEGQQQEFIMTETHQKEEEERQRQEAEQKRRAEEQQWARKQEQEKIRRKQEERRHREQQDRRRKEQQQRRLREKQESERLRALEQERKRKQDQQRQRQEDRRRKQQAERRIQQEERKRKQEQERRRKQEQERQREEQERKRLEQEKKRQLKQQLENVPQLILKEVKETSQQSKQVVQTLIGPANASKIKNFLSHQSPAPIAFWALTLAATFVMLLM